MYLPIGRITRILKGQESRFDGKGPYALTMLRIHFGDLAHHKHIYKSLFRIFFWSWQGLALVVHFVSGFLCPQGVFCAINKT